MSSLADALHREGTPGSCRGWTPAEKDIGGNGNRSMESRNLTKERFSRTLEVSSRLPRWCSVKYLPANAGDARDMDSVPGQEVPWGR